MIAIEGKDRITICLCLGAPVPFMILIPLPFFVSFLLVTVLVQAMRRDETGFRANPLFMLLIAAYAVQSVLIGLRWGYGLREVLPIMSPLAALIAPLAWLSFRSLTREGASISMATIWPHLLPAASIVVLMVLWPDPVGAVIVVIFAAYGAALLWLVRLGPDGLVASRLDGVVRSYRAMQITGFALLASAATDILISMDHVWGGGAHSGAVIAVANVLALLGLGMAASVADSDKVEGASEVWEPEGEALGRLTKEDETVAALVETLMREREIYRDVDLNLGKIARKLQIPSRDVSNAINRSHGMSVSQYVNTYRVKRACQLLKETAEPVTKIMFDAGFMTKSNFNREFSRITGTSPTAWRQKTQSEVSPL